MRQKVLSMIAAVMLFGPAAVIAAPLNTIISFESAYLGSFNSLVIGDYIFRWIESSDQMAVIDAGKGIQALGDSNPFNDQGAKVTMSRIDSMPFSVAQLDVLDPPGGLLSLVAFGAQDVYLSAGTYTPVNLINVTSVAIEIMSIVPVGEGLNGAGALFVNNIHVVSGVPEPDTLMLVGIAGIGMTLGRRALTKRAPGSVRG